MDRKAGGGREGGTDVGVDGWMTAGEGLRRDPGSLGAVGLGDALCLLDSMFLWC